MHEIFDPFREDLDRLCKEWGPCLDGIWENVKHVEDKEERLAMIIEYNRFKDLLHTMIWLKDDKMALTRYSKKIASIRSELHSTRDHESVGYDIEQLVVCIEKDLLHRTPKMHTVTSNIKRCIHVLKQGEEVIPAKLRHELIKRLNVCIVKVNKQVKFPHHGIIIQLCEDRDCIHCAARLVKVKCNTCGYEWQISGNSELDMFAPAKCPECASVDIEESPWRPSEKPFVSGCPKKKVNCLGFLNSNKNST